MEDTVNLPAKKSKATSFFDASVARNPPCSKYHLHPKLLLNCFLLRTTALAGKYTQHKIACNAEWIRLPKSDHTSFLMSFSSTNLIIKMGTRRMNTWIHETRNHNIMQTSASWKFVNHHLNWPYIDLAWMKPGALSMLYLKVMSLLVIFCSFLAPTTCGTDGIFPRLETMAPLTCFSSHSGCSLTWNILNKLLMLIICGSFRISIFNRNVIFASGIFVFPKIIVIRRPVQVHPASFLFVHCFLRECVDMTFSLSKAFIKVNGCCTRVSVSPDVIANVSRSGTACTFVVAWCGRYSSVRFTKYSWKL